MLSGNSRSPVSGATTGLYLLLPPAITQPAPQSENCFILTSSTGQEHSLKQFVSPRCTFALQKPLQGENQHEGSRYLVVCRSSCVPRKLHFVGAGSQEIQHCRPRFKRPTSSGPRRPCPYQSLDPCGS